MQKETVESTTFTLMIKQAWFQTPSDASIDTFCETQFEGTAVPNDPNFWDDLFSNSTAWGLTVYLQDWLKIETINLPVFYQDLDFERQWLLRMGDGAAANGINILYCMSYYRHMLQSVEIESVVSLRASGDYQPGNEQWQIGLTSTWIFAVGLSPYKVGHSTQIFISKLTFKDTFWTTPSQPGSPYGEATETHAELEAAVATLSTAGFSIQQNKV